MPMWMVGGSRMTPMLPVRMLRPGMPAGVMAEMAMRMRDMPARWGGSRAPGDLAAVVRSGFVLALG